MQESTTREKVLKKIRKALIHKTGNPFPQADFDSKLYQRTDESREVAFAGKLMEAGGHFVFCEDRFEFAEQLTTLGAEKKWKNIVCPDSKLGAFLKECEYPFVKDLNDLKKTDAVITFCECLVAGTGSILLSSRQAHGRRLPGIANALIVLAFAGQLTEDIREALQLMKSRHPGRLPSMLTFVTGPSKTADIDLIPITGAHGPAELFVFLIDDSAGF